MNLNCTHWHCFLFVSAILFVNSAFPSEEEFERIEEKYNNVHKFRATGVYEDAGWLFVQVKEPYDENRDNPKRRRLSAVSKATDLLKKWAIDYTSADRDVSDQSPEGIKFAKKIILHYLPNWQFREWTQQYSIHEIPYAIEDGSFIYAQAVKKESVIQCIPPAFSKPFAADDWNIAIGEAVRKGISVDGRESVVRFCRAWNALSDKKTIQDAEYVKLQKELNAYYEQSDRACLYRNIIRGIESPVSSVEWSLRPCEAVVSTNISCVAVTNSIARIVCTTNSSSRIQTAAEIRDGYRSFASRVDVETIQSDVETIDETVTTIVIEKKRYLRSKIETVAHGRAKFERMFVSESLSPASGTKTTKVGDAAQKTYFGPASLKQKESAIVDALRENPNDARLWNLLGKCLLASNDILGAVACFDKSLRADHDYQFALVNLAEAYARLGYRGLAIGMATYARAVAEDKWCITHAEALLKRMW